MLDLVYKTPATRAPLTKLQDGLTVGFRHRRLATLSFLGVFLGAVVGTILLPSRYQANTKILVKHERMDPLVSADSSSPMPQSLEGVTDVEVNSEVELMRSPDLLAKVVTTCGLEKMPAGFLSHLWGRHKDPQKALAAAVRTLRNDLKVEALPKTNLISVTYEAASPQLAAQVLQALVDLYMEKHLEVHQPAGTFEFFQKQTEQYERTVGGGVPPA